ncbi:MAG: hypothetical protein LJE70_07895 [Chromatiaceae bacterium]|nr:hypothetical protein [Chromatiaceae bacterium]
MQNREENRVLILGVYLLDTLNNAAAISDILTQSEDWNVDLRWAGVGCSDAPKELEGITVSITERRISKFRVLNELLELADFDRYQFIIVCDDDIELSDCFLDNFLGLQSKYDFALAQPARTHDSYIDHQFVAQLLGVEARLTRFVEIGPLFSVKRNAYAILLPFDESAPMGWGLDFVWPLQVERNGYRMGIVDATPVKHALRTPVTFYDYDDTNTEMHSFLERHVHLDRSKAFVALETYPIDKRRSLSGGPKRDEDR